METYITKLKHILPTFLTVTLGTVIGLGFIRWFFCLQFSIIDIKEEIWLLWLPLIFPWIPITLWLRQRFRILTFKDNDKGRFGFQMIAWLIIIAMLFVSQGYLTTATGKLKELSTIKDIEKTEKARYYKLTNFSVAPYYGGTYTDFRQSGKYNQYLNFDIYFATPILNDTSERINDIPKYWYGVKFKEQRHLANRFLRENPEARFEVRELKDSQIQEQVIELFHRWKNKKKLDMKADEFEYALEEKAIARLLQTSDKHELIVSCVFLQNDLIGFSIDEILPFRYAISHFAKANIMYNGIYEFLNRETAKYLKNKNIIWWNWEQDLGIETIRKSKMNYNPVNFLKKYKVSLTCKD